MKTRINARNHKSLYLFLTVMAITMICASAMAQTADVTQDKKITGYYYDPDSGKLIPRYDDLSPAASEGYIKGQQVSTGSGTTTVTPDPEPVVLPLSPIVLPGDKSNKPADTGKPDSPGKSDDGRGNHGENNKNK